MKLIIRFFATLSYYPALAWNILLGRVLRLHDWWNMIDQHLVLGAVPFQTDLPVLKNMGIGAVLNLCGECHCYEALLRQYDMNYMYLPVVDFTSPDLDTVLKALSFISDQVENDKKVYVHCRAGRGRSATVVLCWLIREMGVNPEDAMDFLISKRPNVNKKIYQRKVVKEFYKKLHSDL